MQVNGAVGGERLRDVENGGSIALSTLEWRAFGVKQDVVSTKNPPIGGRVVKIALVTWPPFASKEYTSKRSRRVIGLGVGD